MEILTTKTVLAGRATRALRGEELTQTVEWTLEALPVSELAEVAALGARFYRVGNLPGGVHPPVFVATWTAFLNAGFGAIFGLRNEERELIGVLGAVVLPDPNDGVLIGSEFFWWVVPEARGHGLKLLKEYERWAVEDKGAKRIGMVHLLSLSPESLGKLYERRGYKAIEVHYIKEI